MGWLGAAIGAAASIGGALLSAKANKDAASEANEATLRGLEMQAAENEKARAEYRAAARRGIGAIRAGTGSYEMLMRPLTAGPDVLTPSQMIAREDMRRGNMATLASSGLRGAGRGGVGLVMDADRRFLADAYGENQARRDQAIEGLARVKADEGRQIANTEVGVGSQTGATFVGQGAAANEGMRRVGETKAGSTVATGNMYADTLGTVGSIIADELKARSIKPRYGTI